MTKVLKSALHALTVAAAMLMLSLAVAAGALYLGGIVTREKAEDVVKVVRGDLAAPREEAAPEPVKTDLEITSEGELRAAVEQWHKERKAQEEALAVEREAIEGMRRELAAVKSELLRREQALEKTREDFEAARAAEEAAERDAGFQEAVKRYAMMESKDSAKLLYDLDDAAALRYLRAFRTDKAAEILTEIMKLDDKSRAAGAVGVVDRTNRATRLQEMMSGGEADAAAGAEVSAAR